MPHNGHSFGVGIGIAIFEPDSDPDIVANYAMRHYL
jgi:hypothetical protein